MRNVLRSGIILLLPGILFFTACSENLSFTSSRLRSQLFTQSKPTEAFDFLWVLDNSNSMSENRDFVVSNMDNFLSTISKRKEVNFQMTVTTTDYFIDAGSLIKAPSGQDVVTSESLDPTGEFAAIVSQVTEKQHPTWLDDKGLPAVTAYWEQGLESAFRAVQIHGHKFMREGVPLVIIILSDENDYSCSSNCTGGRPESKSNYVPFGVDRYIDFFKAQPGLEPGAQNKGALIFPIIHVDTECTSIQPPRPFDVGSRYMELQNALGTGFSGSICDLNIRKSYDRIAAYISDLNTRFVLKEKPDPTTLKVIVNKVEVLLDPDDGYMYDAASNSIYFSGAGVPPNESEIEIIYSLPE